VPTPAAWKHPIVSVEGEPQGSGLAREIELDLEETFDGDGDGTVDLDEALRSVPASAKAILFGSGPRFARDAFGPVLAFYLGWKVAGLWLGMALAVVVSVAAYLSERRRERPGVMARLSLAILAVQVLTGAALGDAEGFLAPPVVINAIYGLAFLASVAIGRPLAGLFATELHTFPDEVRTSATFRHVFGRVSLTWGTYMLVRSAVRFYVLTRSSVDAYVLFNFLTGFPLVTALMSWSVWYGVRAFRRSEEWGWAFDAAADPTTPAAP
jgi:intracellular septation protein A